MSALKTAAETLGRFVRTVSFLRPGQAVAQVFHRLRGPAQKPRQTIAPGIKARIVREVADGGLPEGVVAADGVSLLGRPPHDPLRDGWHGSDPLWVYTLHYHGWLIAPGCAYAEGLGVIRHWIAHYRDGPGWEPYPTAMRLLHWIVWLGRHRSKIPTSAMEAIMGSIAAQSRHLASHVERHLDGNHLWTNLTGLVAVGLAFEGPLAHRLRREFGPQLRKVVELQLLPDGTHRERTPTYHCVLAGQLSTVLELAAHHPRFATATLKQAHEKMLEALPAITHPDGDVALWGDSQRGLAANPGRLLTKAGRPLPAAHADAPLAGFARRVWGRFTVLWNLGGIAMDHQPGHIHADCLSIELSLDDTRIIVDAGVGTYVPGPDRDYARSTRAHNTVTVGGGVFDQHELWASHRIGARADARIVELSPQRLEGIVQGYRGGCRHRRVVRRDGDSVVIDDLVEGAGGPATVRFHVPGAAVLRRCGLAWTIVVPGASPFRLIASVSLCARRVRGWSAIGVSSPRWCLAGSVPVGGVRVRFESGDAH